MTSFNVEFKDLTMKFLFSLYSCCDSIKANIKFLSYSFFDLTIFFKVFFIVKDYNNLIKTEHFI